MFVVGGNSAEHRCNQWNARWAGKEAGCIATKGYRKVAIDSVGYREHRIIWLIMTGSFPAHQVDHKNTKKDDNRWDNLREAQNFENHQNRGAQSNNTSGMAGVSWAKNMNKWHVYIKVHGMRHTIGYFEDLDEAKIARIAAKAQHHTFHPMEFVK